MPLRRLRPRSPASRFREMRDVSGLTHKEPEPSLVYFRHRALGHNNQGRITMRHRGGGHRRLYRIIDFRRDKVGMPAQVVALEYDPNRSADLALVQYADGEKRYILAPLGLKIGDTVVSGPESDVKTGNALPLLNIPEGQIVHNIELNPGRGGQMVRSAGGGAQILAKEGDYAQIKLPSGEIRRVRLACYATVGQIGNIDHSNLTIGKAGRMRWMGWRPHVRGAAMNPVDHPHGGGEGKSGQGNPHPVSPTGVLAKGYKTRKNKSTDKYIVKDRRL
ncbi:MAG: 50S ribosomal protein L2 [Nitrospirae bacterium]|nr:50S ribosomal protein L2 [Nitrospirota bacterium]